MTTPPPNPLAFLGEALRQASQRIEPPAWLADEAAQRLVLLANHVLMQSSEAMQRLAAQADRVVCIAWRDWALAVRITPAGLLNVAPAAQVPHLRLKLGPEEPLAFAQRALAGERPEVHIEGDARLAAVMGWVMDNVRWDAQADLARITGPVAAQAIAQGARTVAQAVRQFAAPFTSAATAQSPTDTMPPTQGRGVQ